MGSRAPASVVLVHGPSCSMARGIFLDQGSNPHSMHRQMDSCLLHHREVPITAIFNREKLVPAACNLRTLAPIWYLNGENKGINVKREVFISEFQNGDSRALNQA